MASQTAAPPAGNNASAVAPLPVVGGLAPDSPELKLPRTKPTLVVFLRQCGDPFAEKTFRSLATLSEERPELACIAVSQASQAVTDAWVPAAGGAWRTDVVVDAARALYARWGLGLNTSWQMFNPRALYATFALGRDEGIWSRAWGGQGTATATATTMATAAGTGADAAANGNKWQMGGAFAVDALGIVRWVHVPTASEDVADFNAVLELFGMPPLPPPHKRKPRRDPSPVPIPDGQHALYQKPTQRP